MNSIKYYVLSIKGVFWILSLTILTTLYLLLYTPTAGAVYNPTSVPNNRFGIHLISADFKEASDAASLVNTNGDWGYVTVLIESTKRDKNRWQSFFDDLRRRHLIPIVRLATQPVGNYWKRPYDGEEIAWADFLDSLSWPTKNRYILVYNEPNHAREWENEVDPANYAKVLNKTIDALKKKNPDFFVLNAGLDASAPNKMPSYMDSYTFMKKMDEAVPGIFNKLDGWNSHSYPNPEFQGSPDGQGSGTVRTWQWELEVLNELKVTKVLPVFITETGWKHSEGQDFIPSFISTEKAAANYKKAYEEVWNENRIIAVTPFVLNYQDHPFDHFSFKKNGRPEDIYPQFEVIKNMTKTKGEPVRKNRANLEKGEIFKSNLLNSFESSTSGTLSTSLVLNEEYTIKLVVKNTGQSIWNDQSEVKLVPINGGEKLSLTTIPIPQDKKIEPGQSYTFEFKIIPKEGGLTILNLNLAIADKMFESEPFKILFDIKSPVSLKIAAGLKWKEDFQGVYFLTIFGDIKNAVNRSLLSIILNNGGQSPAVETKNLLPDKEYSFTLEKPFYKPKTISKTVKSGINELDFGNLQPDLSSAIINPRELWNLLPWSN